MGAKSFQWATLQMTEACLEEDAFSTASSSPGHLSCIHANKWNRTRAEHPTDACASLCFSVAHMLLFYLHMSCLVLLQAVQHEQKKTQIMDKVGRCLPTDWSRTLVLVAVGLLRIKTSSSWAGPKAAGENWCSPLSCGPFCPYTQMPSRRWGMQSHHVTRFLCPWQNPCGNSCTAL